MNELLVSGCLSPGRNGVRFGKNRWGGRIRNKRVRCGRKCRSRSHATPLKSFTLAIVLEKNAGLRAGPACALTAIFSGGVLLFRLIFLHFPKIRRQPAV